MKNSSASSTFLLIPFLLFLSFLSPLSAQTPKCHPQDEKVVKQIQAAFGINFAGDCCDWEFVVCAFDPPHRVDTFQVYNSNISGQIPAAIGDLSFLRFLVFNNVSNLTGNIPTVIAKLSNLETIIITNTNVSGPIPKLSVNLKNLAKLDLSNNALNGSIPPELSSLFQNTDYIDLHKNKLTGTIPESFGHFPISFISLSHNRLTGTIPKSFGNLDPYSIDLSANRFSGDASLLFGNNKTTLFLYLHENSFTFNLSKVEIPSSLQALTLSHNNIFGSLPQGLTQLNLLHRFNVSYNSLCGEIPQGGRLQNFEAASYFHNKCLCGAPLPACVSRPGNPAVSID